MPTLPGKSRAMKWINPKAKKRVYFASYVYTKVKGSDKQRRQIALVATLKNGKKTEPEFFESHEKAKEAGWISYK